MYLEKQVCNENLSERLKELGVEQKSLFYHTHSKFGILPKQSIDFSGNPTSAFSASELVQMNGNIYGIEFSDRQQKFYTGDTVSDDIIYHDSFSDACAVKLINALSREFVSIQKVNERLMR